MRLQVFVLGETWGQLSIVESVLVQAENIKIIEPN